MGVTVDEIKFYALKYNDMEYFNEDPVIFPRRFAECGACLQDVEIAAVLAAHLAWGRRCMIVRDCARAFDQMDWKPYEYVMRGKYRDEAVSLHRTVMWSEFAAICSRLRHLYENCSTLEKLSPDGFRTEVFGQKSDLRAANKKIHLLRRWMVRRDGKVDIGLWKDTDPASLTIPLDTHVHTQAVDLGITCRRQTDFRTADEITGFFRDIFPSDPVLGDYALFGLGVTGVRLK